MAENLPYHHRALAQPLLKASEQFPIVLLIGARQVGKTTLLIHLSQKERHYVTLDDPLARRLAIEDPALFLQRFPAPVLIDEIQYAPGLLPYIKMSVDQNKRKGMYWLTGSQQFHLMKGVSESLAGRVAVLQLLGLSLNSKEPATPFFPKANALLKGANKFSLKELYYHIWRGFYPAVALDETINRDLFYSSYVQTYLQRDVRDLANVGDEMSFLRFLRAAAARTANLLNMSDLARDADISPVTAKKWLSILEASGIVYLLQPYHTNVTKRLVKTPKLYFIDTGLCSYLTDWTSPETLEKGAMSGAIFETCAVIEILKSYTHAGFQAPLYVYRDKDKQEIDLLIIKDQTIYPIEIKKTASPTKDAIKNFRLLKNLKLPVGPGAVICQVNQPLPLDAENTCIPLSLI